jgi:tripartite-type tricarboxylate transporter receptor subunit TctC
MEDPQYTSPLRINRRTFSACALASASSLAASVWAQAAYPARPIKLLVGFPPGGAPDAIARIVAQRFATQLGQAVVVENRTGAAGLIAAEAVVKSPPDGYTLLMGESSLLVSKHLQPKMGFDPLTAFTPVAGAFYAPLVIVVNNSFEARTPKEFIAQLKANPGKYSYASVGIGSVHHLGFEMLKQQTNSFVVHIPYRGSAQIIPDIMGGQVPMGVVSVSAAIAQANAGKIRPIALLSPSSVPGTQGMPLLSDAVPGFNVAPRFYLLSPAGTPADIVSKLSDAMKLTLESPEVLQRAGVQGATSGFSSDSQIGNELRAESTRWASVIREQKINLDAT